MGFVGDTSGRFDNSGVVTGCLLPGVVPESCRAWSAGFEPQRGVGKIFPHVVGVTASNASARGALAPMEICEANLGSRPKAGVLPGVVGGIRTSKGCGENISTRRRGDSEQCERQRGFSPYGNLRSKFGF